MTTRAPASRADAGQQRLDAPRPSRPAPPCGRGGGDGSRWARPRPRAPACAGGRAASTPCGAGRRARRPRRRGGSWRTSSAMKRRGRSRRGSRARPPRARRAAGRGGRRARRRRPRAAAPRRPRRPCAAPPRRERGREPVQVDREVDVVHQAPVDGHRGAVDLAQPLAHQAADPVGDVAHEGRVGRRPRAVVGEGRRGARVLAVDLQQAHAQVQPPPGDPERPEAPADAVTRQKQLHLAAAAQGRVGRDERGDRAADDDQRATGHGAPGSSWRSCSGRWCAARAKPSSTSGGSAAIIVVGQRLEHHALAGDQAQPGVPAPARSAPPAPRRGGSRRGGRGRRCRAGRRSAPSRAPPGGGSSAGSGRSGAPPRRRPAARRARASRSPGSGSSWIRLQASTWLKPAPTRSSQPGSSRRAATKRTPGRSRSRARRR